MPTLTWTDLRGKENKRTFNDTVAISTHKGAPGAALLWIAANTHLSVADLTRLLECEGIKRSRSWIQRRRWLFQQPGTVNPVGERPNPDGKDARAIELMRAYLHEEPSASARRLSWL